MKSYVSSVKLDLIYDPKDEILQLNVTVQFPARKFYNYQMEEHILTVDENTFRIIYKEFSAPDMTTDRLFEEIIPIDLGSCTILEGQTTLGEVAASNENILSGYKVEINIINEGTGLVGSTFTGINDDAFIDID
jgi:hypothetical protein